MLLPILINYIGGVDNCKVGRVSLQFLRRGTNKHVLAEMGLPGLFGQDAHINTVSRVGPATPIEQVNPPPFGIMIVIVHHRLEQMIENLFTHLAIHRTPPELISGGGLVHDKTVIRGPAGVDPGIHHDSAPGTHPAAVQSQLMFHQPGHRPVAAHLARICNSQIFQAVHCQFLRWSGQPIPRADGPAHTVA